jgi:hypothetical protein
VTAREPIPAEELLRWMEDDWVDLWQLTVAAGRNEGADPEDVLTFVLASVEPGLRAELIALGHVLRARPIGVGFEPIRLPVDELIKIVRDAVTTEDPDWVELDLWLGPGPGAH